MGRVVRFGISMDEELLKRFDDEVVSRGYINRSEAIRDLIRNQLVELDWSKEGEEVAGTITLIYDHHVRGLNDLLLELQHRFHNPDHFHHARSPGPPPLPGGPGNQGSRPGRPERWPGSFWG